MIKLLPLLLLNVAFAIYILVPAVCEEEDEAIRRILARLTVAALVLGMASPVLYGVFWVLRWLCCRGVPRFLTTFGWLLMLAFERKPKEPKVELPKARVVS